MKPAIPLTKERLIMQLKHSYYSKPLRLGKDCLSLENTEKLSGDTTQNVCTSDLVKTFISPQTEGDFQWTTMTCKVASFQ